MAVPILPGQMEDGTVTTGEDAHAIPRSARGAHPCEIPAAKLGNG